MQAGRLTPVTLVSMARAHWFRMKRPLGLALLLATLPAAAQTVPVLLLSDIHLDPFHDPAKVAQLRAAPVEGWAAILDGPPSATQAADFERLQSGCGARGVDTAEELFASALKAAHAQQAQPLFVTVSGDLMAHAFDCRFRTVAPSATAADYSAFAAKTVAYVALQLRLTFPHTPVFLALGNNDSGCKDYREDPSSAFLKADGESFAADMTTPANHAAIAGEFSEFGDYNVALPLPKTRLIVLQDIFESSKYTTCDGKPAVDSSAAQIAWLRKQLAAARAANQRVWVMAHIPPGIDAYSTIRKTSGSYCPAGAAETFTSEGLASVLSKYAGTIKLALFGHTHMDEFRVFQTDETGKDGDLVMGSKYAVPGKLVPSISPVNGNTPAFTIATVDPATAVLQDYTVFYIANFHEPNPAPAVWAEEYRFSTTYHLPDVSGESVAKLTASLIADKSGTTDATRAYQRFYYAGEPGGLSGAMGLSATLKAAVMQRVWPVYACTLANFGAESFRACACPATP
jgi:sphingomyelin phosphodiesterase acid-like 3